MRNTKMVFDAPSLKELGELYGISYAELGFLSDEETDDLWPDIVKIKSVMGLSDSLLKELRKEFEKAFLSTVDLSKLESYIWYENGQIHCYY